MQTANGVVDLVAEDDADAVRLAKQYLVLLPGRRRPEWTCADQRLLRTCVPENRLRAYDIADLIAILADTGSVLELRSGFGPGMVTALVRIEGRAVGVVANDPGHLGGAIDSDGADKAARFLQLCDAHEIPILFLCDTPGFMVGPEAEQSAQVRHFSRLFVIGASLTVPFFTIVLRKGYGLGAQAMAGGSFRSPLFVVAWPTGELGGMGLEGAVRLGFRRELDAVEDPDRAGGPLRAHGRSRLPAREGAERGHRVRDRRRDRSGRLEAEDRRGAAVGATAARPHREEAELHRHLVISRAARGGAAAMAGR